MVNVVGGLMFASGLGKTKIVSKVITFEPQVSPDAPEQPASSTALDSQGATAALNGQNNTSSQTNTILGTDKSTGQSVRVSDVDRDSGMYILGTMGQGKSSLLEGLIFQDIRKGYPVFVIDPHGDLVEHVISQIPQERLKDTYLLDMEDENFPFGVNVFTGRGTTTIAQTQAVDRVMHIFDVLWGDVLSQQSLPRYLRAATITLLANPGTTSVDMYDFLMNDDLRERMLKKVTDPTVKQFWEYQYDNKSQSVRTREIASLINRLEALFMGRGIVRNIVGQSQTTINFRRSIENKEIVLIKLPLKTLPQDASLIGTMLVAQLHAAIFSFADTRLEDRPGFSLFVDEFQHFATADFSEMFTEGRKFGSRVCLAHQMRSQIPDTLKTLQSATLNARTVICFQTTNDAATMTYLYPEKVTVDVNTIPRDPLDYLLNNRHPVEEVNSFTRFIAVGDEMWQNRRQSIQIKNKPSWIVMDEFLKRNDWPDARFVLTELLSDCMRYQRSDYPIPPKAVHALMFINGLDAGVKSLVEFNPSGSSAAYVYLKIDVPPSKFAASTQFQQLCSAPTVDQFVEVAESIESRLSGMKKDEFEDSMDVLYCLRSTMQVLAETPLGERHTTSRAEMINAIQSQQPREAFVKVSDRKAAIKTLDTPQPVPEREQQIRKQAILVQTRAKYCQSKTHVMQEIMQRLGRAEVEEQEVEAGSQSVQREPLAPQEPVGQTATPLPASKDTMNILSAQMKAKEIDPDTTILASLGEHYVLTIKQWMRLFEWGSYPRATQNFKELKDTDMIYRKDREGRGGVLVEGDWFFLLTKGANELQRRRQDSPLFRLEPNEAERASGDTLVHTYLVNELLIHLRLLERAHPEIVKIEQIDHERSMRRYYLAALADSKLYPDGFLRLLVPTPNGLKQRHAFLELQHTTQRDEANWKTKCRKYLDLFDQADVLNKYFATRTPQVLVITMEKAYIASHKQWTEEVLAERGQKGRTYGNRFLIGSYDPGISDMSLSPEQFFCAPRFSLPFLNTQHAVFGA